MTDSKQIPTDPPTFDAQGNPRTKRMKLDPELGDGQHWTIHDLPDDILLGMLWAWLEEAQPGDSVTIEVIAMSDVEEAALPEV